MLTEEDLKQTLLTYFRDHPEATVASVSAIVNEAYQDTITLMAPKMKLTPVTPLYADTDVFDDSREAVEHKVARDERTDIGEPERYE